MHRSEIAELQLFSKCSRFFEGHVLVLQDEMSFIHLSFHFEENVD